ncbi:MAG: glycosyl hydrolase family 5 [Pelagibacteraceae bacterium]|nr:glycosyl hydrolase family 5 [Pelagibacteraceae bacterium]PPR51570.1 MAG: hypothetical protein CFH20_00498 [Alphaproteobacteria bacterium MarineAlpha5_Bin10]|tara:strand:- start:468 stop:857 length:390 start_codon:yes stop_codon:yes gene_type:complete
MNLGNPNRIKLFIIIIFFNFIPIFSLAENINGNTVTIGALDKITAKFSEFDINVGDTGTFGSLRIEIFQCQKRPPEELPEDFVLLQIFDYVDDQKPKIVFSGWMLSSSPSLSALEHPVYDIWLENCFIN